MTLQVLRNRVGDADFCEIARTWVQEQGGGTGTTAQFIALAERISGSQLDDLFDAWLFTGSKPALESAMRTTVSTASSAGASPNLQAWDEQFRVRVEHGDF